MYFESARQIGEWMGQKGKTLIYGGASLGLMECVARAVKENGGKVIGVVPAKLEENGKVSTLLDEEIHIISLFFLLIRSMCLLLRSRLRMVAVQNLCPPVCGVLSIVRHRNHIRCRR